ncbi:MAG: hypothetical protein VXW97_01095 [Pseudomonadota bacterium]|nr:hypothetical protein [Pseudomonadota bacterium]
MDTKFKNGDVFLRGFAYPTEWIVINIKLINDIVHYELKDVRSPKSVVLSEWALIKDDSWKFHKKKIDEE